MRLLAVFACGAAMVFGQSDGVRVTILDADKLPASGLRPGEYVLSGSIVSFHTITRSFHLAASETQNFEVPRSTDQSAITLAPNHLGNR